MDSPHATLAERQRALVAALLGIGPAPDGFDTGRLRTASDALLRKRSGEVANAWPQLARSFGTRWVDSFGAWARGRPRGGSIRDGWDFARSHIAELSAAAASELACREALWRYDSEHQPVRRRLPWIARCGAAIAVGAFGRTWVLWPSL